MKIKETHYYKEIPYREIDINLNLIGIPNYIVKKDKNSNESYILATKQEQFVKKELIKIFPLIEWKTTQELLGGKFNPEANRILGDINGIHPQTRELICIDVKVCTADASNNFKCGTIHQSSISGFANNKNHYYLSITKDGSDYIMIPGVDIYNIYCKRPCLYPVEDNDTKLNYKIDDSKYVTKKKPAFSCGKDYMPSFVFYPRYKDKE